MKTHVNIANIVFLSIERKTMILCRPIKSNRTTHVINKTINSFGTCIFKRLRYIHIPVVKGHIKTDLLQVSDFLVGARAANNTTTCR